VTPTRFVRSIDQLSTRSGERRSSTNVFGRAADAWIELVKGVVLRQPQLTSRLL
jgi:hypothetical protein